MTKKSFLNIIGALFVFAFVLASCEKEEEKAKTAPVLATFPTTEVADYTAKAHGFIVTDGNLPLSERGFVYSKTGEPTVADSKTTEVTGKAYFEATLTGLTHFTTYYVRAFATNEMGTVYGVVDTFKTSAIKATVATSAATDITGNSANVVGNVSYDGESDVTERGVVYGFSANPTVADSKVVVGNGEGEFTAALTNLKGNKKYYVRAYAINGVGTAYGNQVEFSTPVDFTKVATSPASMITKTSAVLTGEVTDDGGADVTARGFYWNMTGAPTADDNIVDMGTGVGMFTYELTGLELNTKYYVRAFATNSAGTTLGEVKEFTTLANIIKWYMPGDYQGWSPSTADYVINSIEDPNNMEGYVNMKIIGGGFKFTSEPDWNHNNYGDAGGGKLSTSGGDIKLAEPGYYKMNVNPIDLTFTAVKCNWGIIGDAIPGNNWSKTEPLTYNETTKIFEGVFEFQIGGWKYRGTDDWAVNFGDNGADGIPEYGGDNIPMTEAGWYEVTLDLSVPREYKISHMNWGIIGDATPGGWGTDTNMSWDAANQVWTITVDLIGGKQLKFRGKDDWAYNYGDNGADGSLEKDGSNIDIAESGNYTVTFSKKNLTYTITKN